MFNFYKSIFKMATRKRKTRKRKTGLHSQAGLSKRGATRRRRTKRKTGLGEAFSPAQATHSAKNMAGGAIGGFAYGFGKPAIDSATDNKLIQGLVVLGASFLASSVMKMDAVSSGIAGAWGADMSRKMQGLSEMNETEFADDDALSEEPEYLDEAGNPMFLAEDGNFYYLEEMNEDEEDEHGALDEPTFLADGNFYPEYVNTSNY